MLDIHEKIVIMDLLEKELLEIDGLWQIAQTKELKEMMKDNFNDRFKIYIKVATIEETGVIINTGKTKELKQIYKTINSI